MGPVRVGNQALRAAPERRLRQRRARRDAVVLRPAPARTRGGDSLFRAARDASASTRCGSGTGPTRASGSSATRKHVHTFSAVMCWAACDRLARIARISAEPSARSTGAHAQADPLRAVLDARLERARAAASSARSTATSSTRSCCCCPSSASCRADDPRFVAHARRDRARAAARRLSLPLRGADDFGAPNTAFNICTFWYIDALAAVGRRDEARELFENMLARRNARGPAVRGPRRQDGRALGQLPADLLDGRPDQLGDAPVEALGL